MDKKKILVLGTGNADSLIAKLLKDCTSLYDMEFLEVGELVHKQAEQVFNFDDELTKLGDFSKLEERIMGNYALRKGAVLTDVFTVEKRNQDKELTFIDWYHSGQINAYFSIANNSPTGRLSQIAVKEGKVVGLPFGAPYGKSLYVGIDHPSRKREPKGPRGKWGKIK